MILLIMPIEWTPELELHIKIIDLQHKQLIKIINKILERINKPISDVEIDSIFQEALRYTQYHFGTEEFFLKKFNCDPVQTAVHIQEHENFKKEVTYLYGLLKTEKNKTTFKLIDLLENWLIHHIPNIDRKYVDCFHKNNLF